MHKIQQSEQLEQNEKFIGKPRLNRNSILIAKRVTAEGRRGTDGFEHLYQEAERQRQERELAQEAKLAEDVPAYPAITRQAADLVRTGPISERLYNDALRQRKKQEDRIDAAQEQTMANASKTAGIRVSQKASTRLYTQGAAQRSRRQKAINMKHTKETRRSHRRSARANYGKRI